MTEEDIGLVDSSVEQPQVSQEKMLPQSQVNTIVAAQVREAREKAEKRHALEMERLKSQMGGQPSSIGGMPQASEEQLRQMIAEQTQRALQEQRDAQLEQLRLEQGQRVAGEFLNKMKIGKQKYDDFDKVVESVDFRTIPEIVALTHNLDNADDVVYEILKNPHKAAQILTLAGRNELLAQKAIKEVSDSIKINDAAKKAKSVNEPISQLDPSSIGMDNGQMTINDYRNKPWARA